jgi:hypothetical protein
VSRGRELVRLYNDDKASMMEAIQSSSKRMSATELMEGEAPAKKQRSPLLQKIIQMFRAQRLYKGAHQRAFREQQYQHRRQDHVR